MSRYILVAVTLTVTVGAGRAAAADAKAIDSAVQRGADFLKSRYKGGLAAATIGNNAGKHGIGPVALAGIALLEAKVPANDPIIRGIAAAVREASYRETQTYQTSLCLIFLDRLEDPADVPLIQMLALRLVWGQSGNGGWSYYCVDNVPAETERWLRESLKNNQLVGGNGPAPAAPGKEPVPVTRGVRLHPALEKYAAALQNGKKPSLAADNSNTQFALLAVWIARKHGVPVEPTLDAVEKMFLLTQDQQSGGWGYTPGAPLAAGMGDSPAMTCAGLLGLATGVARREERRARTPKEPVAAPKDPKAKDPFFNPPTRPAAKKPADPPREAQTPAVRAGFARLGALFAARLRGVQFEPIGGSEAFDRDLYFLWSLERVGVIYGVDKIGGLDWYTVGSDLLVRTQGQDGSWGSAGSYGPEVCTSFALLFLSKADIARDLSSRVKKDPANSELRSGTSAPPAEPAPGPKPSGTATTTPNTTPKPLPVPVEDESGKLAAQLTLAGDADWMKALARVRDAKGGDYTKALVIAIHRLDGDRKKEARDALAERLTRMSAATLRAMAKAEDAELRRGAVLACAMRDDRAHAPDLIDRLADDADLVVRAARAGLKSLSGGQDFGPKPGATKAERKAAADAWRAWWAAQK